MGFTIKDSGEKRKFITGAHRDAATGKGRYDLISPIALKRLAIHYESGGKKYGDRNWEQGFPLHSLIDSALRHLSGHLEGLRDEDHLAAALFNIVGIIHTEEMIKRGLLPKELDDLPNYIGESNE